MQLQSLFLSVISEWRHPRVSVPRLFSQCLHQTDAIPPCISQPLCYFCKMLERYREVCITPQAELLLEHNPFSFHYDLPSHDDEAPSHNVNALPSTLLFITASSVCSMYLIILLATLQTGSNLMLLKIQQLSITQLCGEAKSVCYLEKCIYQADFWEHIEKPTLRCSVWKKELVLYHYSSKTLKTDFHLVSHLFKTLCRLSTTF